MEKRTFSIRTPHGSHRLIALAAASVLTGCAFFDPYVGMPQQLPPDRLPSPMRFAGNAGAEIDLVEAVRQDYLDRMEQMGRTRAFFGTGATVLTGWALYNALKPNAPGVTETPIGDKRRTVRLGASIATIFGLSEYALNKNQESAYNDGYQALTCLLRQSAPLLMPMERDHPTLGPQPDSFEALQQALVKLEKRILDLNQAVASARVGLAEGQALATQHQARQIGDFIATNDALPDKPARKQDPKKLNPAELSAAIAKMAPSLPADVADKSPLLSTLDDAVTALRYARNAWADGQALLKATAGSGREIRERAHTIVSTINGRIGKAQPDVTADTVSLTKAQDIISGFTKIGVETAKDQAESSGETTSALPPPLQDRLPYAAAAPAEPPVRIAGLGSPGLPMFAGSLATVLLASAAIAPAPADAAKSPAGAASAPKPPAPAIPAAAKPQPKPTPATLTVEELQKLSDLMKRTLKEAKQRQADEAQNQLIGGYVKQIDALSKPRNLCKSSNHHCDAAAIAKQVERLYAARRPVVATVLHFRAQTKTVRRVSGCPSEAGIRLTPNETVVAQAGDSFNFVVTQPNPGAPVALLQGAQGADLATLTTSSLGAAGLQAKVQFGIKAKGRYTLLATDSSGDFRDSVQIIVKPAKNDDANKPAAKASDTTP